MLPFTHWGFYSIFPLSGSRCSPSNDSNAIAALCLSPPRPHTVALQRSLQIFQYTIPLSSLMFPILLFFILYFLPSSILSSHLPTVAAPPTAPLLSGCQIKVKIFFRMLGSAFLLSWGYFPFPPQTIEFSFWALVVAFLIGGWSERVGGGDLFAVCDLCGFLKLIIPHRAQLWHCGGWHKSADSCCWAGADPGESFPFSCVFFFLSSHSSTLSFPSASPPDLLHLFR